MNGGDGALLGLVGIEIGRGKNDHVAFAPAGGIQDFDLGAAGLGCRRELGPAVRAVAVQVQRPEQHHDPAVPHGIDVFIGDVVGEGDRRLVRIGLGFAADVQFAARHIDPLGRQIEIAIVRKAELAVDRQTAQRRRTDVEDDVLAPANRHRVIRARHLPVGPGRRIGPARPVDRRRRWLRVCFLSAGFRPDPKQEGRRNQQGKQNQARLHVHDVDPLTRDRVSRNLHLNLTLQHMGRFAKPLSGARPDVRFRCWSAPGIALAEAANLVAPKCRARPPTGRAPGLCQGLSFIQRG